MPQTYFKSVFLQYSKVLFFTLLIFTTIILIFDILELSRITSKYSLSLSFTLKLALMKNYSSLNKTIPMIVLISSLLYFNTKSSNNEIIAAKSIGITKFNIILPILIVVLIFGIINTTAINPIGTLLLKKYQNYEANKFKREKSLISISKTGIWLKNKFEDQNVFINALRVSQISKNMSDVKIFFINNDGELEKQIYAKNIDFKEKYISINEAVIIDKKYKISKKEKIDLPIIISISQILDNFTTAETISFYDLLDFIKITEKSGLAIDKYILYFLNQLLTPIYLLSMSLISFFFACKIQKKQKFNISLLYGLVFGFIVYFLTNLIYALGSSSNISAIFAAFFPTIVANTIAVYLILYKSNN